MWMSLLLAGSIPGHRGWSWVCCLPLMGQCWKGGPRARLEQKKGPGMGEKIFISCAREWRGSPGERGLVKGISW